VLLCNIFKNILNNNEYNTNLVGKNPSLKNKTHTITPNTKKTKWVTFTYSGKEVRKITKLFRDMQIRITFRIQNTVQNVLKAHTQTGKYNRSGINQMKCLAFPLKYRGQTERTLNTRYKEHIQDVRNNRNSGY
jgi:hypothetical protein